MKRIYLTEEQFKRIVKSTLMESVGGPYYAIYDYDWHNFEPIEPIQVLTKEQINRREEEVLVQGDWEFVNVENTNYFGDDRHGANFCLPGDLVFYLASEHVFYRPGIGTPAGAGTYDTTTMVGTREELINFALTYWEEILDDTGEDVREFLSLDA